MNKKLLILATFAFVFFITIGLSAQDRVLYGKVTTFDSIPLISANVKVQSTKQTVLTDSLGNFSVFCNAEDKLEVSAEAFYTQKVKLTSNIKFAAINLKLKSDKKSVEHTIGYGHISANDKSNAVENFVLKDKDYSRYSNMYDLIRGRFAGVQVVGTEIIIHGEKSFQGSSAALIVVDGVISDADILNTMSPNTVKSINVIKDGTSAIYGSRGANGVIMIETKKGGDN